MRPRPRVGRAAGRAPSSLAGCDYVVVPPEASAPGRRSAPRAGRRSRRRSAPTEAGDLRIELDDPERDRRLERDGGDRGRPAVLTARRRQSTDCATVDGRHRRPSAGARLPDARLPGRHEERARRRSSSASSAPARRPAPGSKLAIDYRYVTGEYNYYDPDATRDRARRSRSTSTRSPPTSTYPVAEPVDGLIQPPDTEITAHQRRRPDARPASTGPGRPRARLADVEPGRVPVVGAHRRPAGDRRRTGSSTATTRARTSPRCRSRRPAGRPTWTTDVEVPADVTGLVMLLSVESKKQRLFVELRDRPQRRVAAARSPGSTDAAVARSPARSRGSRARVARTWLRTAGASGSPLGRRDRLRGPRARRARAAAGRPSSATA